MKRQKNIYNIFKFKRKDKKNIYNYSVCFTNYMKPLV